MTQYSPHLLLSHLHDLLQYCILSSFISKRVLRHLCAHVQKTVLGVGTQESSTLRVLAALETTSIVTRHHDNLLLQTLRYRRSCVWSCTDITNHHTRVNSTVDNAIPTCRQSLIEDF